MNTRSFRKFGMVAMTTLLLVACSDKETTDKKEKADSNLEIALPTLLKYEENDLYQDWKNESYTSITLNKDEAEVTGEGATFKENVVTISKGGIYVFEGTLTDGQVEVNSTDSEIVRLIFNGVEITNNDGAAIVVTDAEKTVISLEKGTKNTISDGKTYSNTSEEAPNATIFSKKDLTVNGDGSLVVNGNFNNGIVSKDDLKLVSGTISVNTKDDGIIGRDALAVKEAKINVKSGGDGLRSTHDEDENKGFVQIDGGDITVISANDGIQAAHSMIVNDGEIDITSGTGSENAEIKSEGFAPGMGGKGFGGKEQGTQVKTETEEESSKGLKAENNIVVKSGTITIDSYDDAIHSNNLVYLSGGKVQVSSGDDGVHGNEKLVIDGADVDVLYSYEGLESKVITLESGNVTVIAEDDGVNANEEGSSEFNIKGGYLSINAKGDGLDSNGNVEMTGGTVVVSGPTNNGNGSLDFNGTFNLKGGTLVAAGSTGMFQTPSDSSTQHSIFMTFPSTLKANTVVHVEDSKGNTIATYAPEKEFQAILISSANLKDGEEYTIYTGGKSDGKATNGYYTKGTYTKGEKVVTFKLSDDITTWVDQNGVTEAKKSGMMPGEGGQGREGGQPGQGGQPPSMGENSGGQAPNMGGQPPGDQDMFGNLSDEDRQKLEEIMEKQQKGEITQEEAMQQINELGIEFPSNKE